MTHCKNEIYRNQGKDQVKLGLSRSPMLTRKMNVQNDGAMELQLKNSFSK